MHFIDVAILVTGNPRWLSRPFPLACDPSWPTLRIQYLAPGPQLIGLRDYFKSHRSFYHFLVAWSLDTSWRSGDVAVLASLPVSTLELVGHIHILYNRLTFFGPLHQSSHIHAWMRNVAHFDWITSVSLILIYSFPHVRGKSTSLFFGGVHPLILVYRSNLFSLPYFSDGVYNCIHLY